MPQSGTLKVWHDDRGFGFIRPGDGSPDVFVHVRAMPREGPRPLVGEALLFEIESGKDGRPRAVRVRRPGQATPDAEPRARRSPPRPLRRVPPRQSWLSRWMGWVVLLLAVAFGLAQVRAWQQAQALRAAPLPTSDSVQTSPVPTERFQCDGRTQCNQMTSCAEATYFLRRCPGAQMDGDGDGVPCEQQWCGGG
ncbi:MAG: cold shock domain-containing protein [Hydrogenophaga sp.]|uniref:cold shock domain-containing protein n=1 Tax=Hydrogenophaga sp. TaxID=1904254 RepID=UPI001DD049BC|nr:cold shock domain-containing protein [Hydrogenophaga sp.]MBX3608329.1 cold shock domain-containing protein [Hydrogenophaga sp.]